MKIYAKTNTVHYNNSKTEVGSPLKTRAGSIIKRSTKYDVGKVIGSSVYVHKNYADEVIPEDILQFAEDILESEYPDFNYNCIKYNMANDSISFQEVPKFDIDREPAVGDYVIVKPDGSIKFGHSDYIFHHKWLWVKNDYAGFDVGESWDWSRTWLNQLEEPSDGNGIHRWNNQLDKYNLPHDNL